MSQDNNNCIKHANNLTGFLGFVKGPNNESTEETSNKMKKTIDGIEKYISEKRETLTEKNIENLNKLKQKKINEMKYYNKESTENKKRNCDEDVKCKSVMFSSKTTGDGWMCRNEVLDEEVKKVIVKTFLKMDKNPKKLVFHRIKNLRDFYIVNKDSIKNYPKHIQEDANNIISLNLETKTNVDIPENESDIRFTAVSEVYVDDLYQIFSNYIIKIFKIDKINLTLFTKYNYLPPRTEKKEFLGDCDVEFFDDEYHLYYFLEKPKPKDNETKEDDNCYLLMPPQPPNDEDFDTLEAHLKGWNKWYEQDSYFWECKMKLYPNNKHYRDMFHLRNMYIRGNNQELINIKQREKEEQDIIDKELENIKQREKEEQAINDEYQEMDNFLDSLLGASDDEEEQDSIDENQELDNLNLLGASDDEEEQNNPKNNKYKYKYLKYKSKYFGLKNTINSNKL
jgi:hypothetical protein